MAIAKEDILAAVEGMTVLELNELVKAFEEKFGVSAAAVAVAGPAAAAPLLQLKRRPSSRSFWLKRAATRLQSSRPFAKSRAWA